MLILLCAGCPGIMLRAQAQDPWHTPLNAVAVGAAYSNDSSHIILGQSFNRRFGELELTYSRRVGRRSAIAYTWDIEARPWVMLQDPVATVTLSSSIPGRTPITTTIPETPVQSRCDDLSESATFPVSTPTGSTTETFSLTRVCSTRWTYAGGLSPVGQRLNFWPRHTLQPYLLANAGFLVSTRDIPANDSSRFNFTFSFGAGIQWFRPDGAAWAVDYRVQHLSNKQIGDNNPGIDSQTFRVSYSLPPWHKRLARPALHR